MLTKNFLIFSICPYTIYVSIIGKKIQLECVLVKEKNQQQNENKRKREKQQFI